MIAGVSLLAVQLSYLAAVVFDALTDFARADLAAAQYDALNDDPRRLYYRLVFEQFFK